MTTELGTTLSVRSWGQMNVDMARFEVQVGPDGPPIGSQSCESSKPTGGDAEVDSLVRVLVVDDEDDGRESIIALIESEGYSVRGAANGAEALLILEAGLRPALMLVDLRMPVMDGWELCAAIAKDERLVGIPIAIVTGADARSERMPEHRAGGVLIKPVKVANLLAILRKFCGN